MNVEDGFYLAPLKIASRHALANFLQFRAAVGTSNVISSWLALAIALYFPFAFSFLVCYHTSGTALGCGRKYDNSLLEPFGGACSHPALR